MCNITLIIYYRNSSDVVDLLWDRYHARSTEGVSIHKSLFLSARLLVVECVQSRLSPRLATGYDVRPELVHVFQRQCSSSSNLHIPSTNLHFGSRSLHIAAPTVWNSPPSTLRSSRTLNILRKHLETHLFQSVFSSP